MRYVLAALMCIGLPTLAPAQQAAPMTPPPSIGLPLPPIGLPLPSIGLESATDQPVGSLNPNPPAFDGRRHFRRRPAIVIFGAPYAFGIDPTLQSARPGMIAPSAPVIPEPATGRLRLEVEPEDLAQIFIDGEYVGTPYDLNREIDLAPGRRQVEIRAPGYGTLTFDTRVVAGRTITFRETLKRVVEPGAAGQPAKPGGGAAAASPSPTLPTSPKSTFYLIPGCYLGNVPPEQVKLPPDCDLSLLITHTPK